MKLRHALVLLFVAALGVTFAGCGGDSDVANPTDRSAGDSGNSGNSGSSDDDSSASIPSTSDPVRGFSEDCAMVVRAWTSAQSFGFTNRNATQQAQDELTKIKDKVSEGIAADIATATKGFEVIATEGFNAPEAMGSQEFAEFKDARDRLTKFFQDGCGGEL